MTDIPKKLVIDVAAGTSQYIELTPAEIQQRELDAIAAATARAEQEADQEAKATAAASAKAKLAALGLTEDEIAAL